jgi:uncharacterized membrane protein
MVDRNPESTAKIAGHPLHPMLIPFPIAFLVATFACDFMFWQTGNAAWSTAALYLLGAALVMAGLAAVAGFTDFLGGRPDPGPIACMAPHARQPCRRAALGLELVPAL